VISLQVTCKDGSHLCLIVPWCLTGSFLTYYSHFLHLPNVPLPRTLFTKQLLPGKWVPCFFYFISTSSSRLMAPFHKFPVPCTFCISVWISPQFSPHQFWTVFLPAGIWFDEHNSEGDVQIGWVFLRFCLIPGGKERKNTNFHPPAGPTNPSPVGDMGQCSLVRLWYPSSTKTLKVFGAFRIIQALKISAPKIYTSPKTRGDMPISPKFPLSTLKLLGHTLPPWRPNTIHQDHVPPFWPTTQHHITLTHVTGQHYPPVQPSGEHLK
jgi:hypothetical protein